MEYFAPIAMVFLSLLAAIRGFEIFRWFVLS